MYHFERAITWPCRYFCFRGHVSPGLCSICQFPCRTRSCRCSYMHAECAQLLVHEAGNRCNICNSRIWRFRLQARPKDTAEDRELMQQQRHVQERREKKMLRRIAQWKTRVWPAAARTFYGPPRDVQLALAHLASHDARESFHQRYMDSGGDGHDASKVARQFCWMHAHYDHLSPRVRTALRRGMIASYAGR